MRAGQAGSPEPLRTSASGKQRAKGPLRPVPWAAPKGIIKFLVKLGPPRGEAASNPFPGQNPSKWPKLGSARPIVLGQKPNQPEVCNWADWP